MSLLVVWSRAANAEFQAAEQWYAEISQDLAGRFVQAVEDSLRVVAQFPHRFPTIH